VFLKPVTGEEPSRIESPTLATGFVDEEESKEDSDVEQNTKDVDMPEDKSKQIDEEDPFSGDFQLSEELITLSRTPQSKWKTLVNLELVQERNKPVKPAETPKSAPFLLPTLPGVEPTFVVTAPEAIDDLDSKIFDMSKLRPRTKFIVAMEEAHDSADCAFWFLVFFFPLFLKRN
jgi:U3 small nucleolar RNA-associated protein 21